MTSTPLPDDSAAAVAVAHAMRYLDSLDQAPVLAR